MVSMDWTLGVQIVNFIILIFILNSILYKPIRGILQQRKSKIEGLEDSITSINQEAESRNQALSDGIKQARSKGQKEKEIRLHQASEEERVLIDRINSRAQEELSAVKAKIAKDAGSVRVALEKDIEKFAKAITQKLLGRAA